MPEYKARAEARVGIRASAEAVYSEATFKRIVEDAVWYRRQAMQNQIDDGQRRRYARTIVLLMAFYLESLSNLLFEELVGEDLKLVERRTDLPQPLHRFRTVHNKLLGKELTLNTDGIQDIFTIRNKVIAHPAGRAQLRTGKIGWSRTDKQVSYKKFKEFSSIYSHFTLQEADTVLKEVREFVTKFLELVKDKLSEEQIKEWWPNELVEWSEQASKHYGGVFTWATLEKPILALRNHKRIMMSREESVTGKKSFLGKVHGLPGARGLGEPRVRLLAVARHNLGNNKRVGKQE